ncbi:MAG: GTP 3',8-cyclase MoaA [Deltaproteobacteria bacterium]|nr:GTP 3',8-cyclase MoaA [Deltaproteobacteria bacterium]
MARSLPPKNPPRGPIIDPFGRRIHYVRMSVTDRCNFRCVYCMPEEGVEFTQRDELMTFEEIEQLGRVLSEMGVDRIRLTGGEPTVRRDIIELVRRLGSLPMLNDLAMTTNGWNLAKIGPDLKAAGLTRVNISIDTLDRQRFIDLARVDRLDDVLAGIEAVVAMDWLPLKLNVVVCDGMNEDEVATFVDRFAHLPVTIRFIEYMPFGESRFELVPWSRTRARLEERYTLVPAAGPDGSGPANYWSVAGTAVVVGAIGALSRQFCEACNRVRITSDGRLKNCLAYEPQMVSLRDVMRSGGTDDDLEVAIRAAILRKPLAHITGEDMSNPFEGEMIQIGG